MLFIFSKEFNTSVAALDNSFLYRCLKCAIPLRVCQIRSLLRSPWPENLARKMSLPLEKRIQLTPKEQHTLNNVNNC